MVKISVFSLAKVAFFALSSLSSMSLAGDRNLYFPTEDPWPMWGRSGAPVPEKSGQSVDTTNSDSLPSVGLDFNESEESGADDAARGDDETP